MKKKWIALIFILLVFICIYIFTGFFVIQPIGAIPQSRTIWYLRSGFNIPFVSSDAWDLQIEADAASGELDAFAEKAIAEYKSGKVREI